MGYCVERKCTSQRGNFLSDVQVRQVCEVAGWTSLAIRPDNGGLSLIRGWESLRIGLPIRH